MAHRSCRRRQNDSPQERVESRASDRVIAMATQKRTDLARASEVRPGDILSVMGSGEKILAERFRHDCASKLRRLEAEAPLISHNRQDDGVG